MMQRSKLLQWVLTSLNKISPKKDIILFNSFPPFSDNALALYEYIICTRSDITKKYTIIWGQEKGSAVPEYLKQYGIKTVIKKSPRGIVLFLSAKYIFTTHGYFPGAKSGNGQLQINLWHGCGYKSMTESDSVYHGDINTVTGSIYVPIHEKIFNMGKGTVFPTGLPRNDMLFRPTTALRTIGIQKSVYQKVFIWMPTYRKAKLGHFELDGDDTSFTIATMNRAEVEKLNRVLTEKRYLLIVKPHPMDAKGFENLAGFSNILPITNDLLFRAGVQLYELLADTDCLLSDYSSVVIDYLLLRKPVAMVMADIDAYQKSRGFVFTPVEDYVPGPVIINLEALLDYFSNSDEIDAQWEPKRMQLTKLFHDHMDDCSCERVCNLVFGKSGESAENL